MQTDLLTAYPPDTPAVIVYRLCWPDEKIIQTTLDRIAEVVEANKFLRTTLILVGAALGDKKARSRLYHPGHAHIFRKARHCEESAIDSVADDEAIRQVHEIASPSARNDDVSR